MPLIRLPKPPMLTYKMLHIVPRLLLRPLFSRSFWALYDTHWNQRYAIYHTNIMNITTPTDR